MYNIQEIRNLFIAKFKDGDFVIDKTGVKTIEIIGATFLADEDYIFRKPNYDYIKKEIAWYESMSRNVNTIKDTPKIWKDVATPNGYINSNYGWCVWSNENGNQYVNTLNELKQNPNSRRATMIYNRPSMHKDYNFNGMSDFICTYANQFFIRNGKLVSHYIMRSQDCIFGYNNDFAWAKYLQEKLANDLNIEAGDIIWTASSLHIYERHFNYLLKK